MSEIARSAIDQYHELGYLIRHEPLLTGTKFERLKLIFEEHPANKVN